MSAVAAPIRVHIGPRGHCIALEAFFRLSLGMGAVAPLRQAIMIRIKHNVGIEGLTCDIGAGTFPGPSLISAEGVQTVGRITSRGADAWGRRQGVKVRLAVRVSTVVLPDAPRTPSCSA